MTVLRGNYIFVDPGQKAFLAASNYTNYVLLGEQSLNSFWLEASIENDEFVVSANLFDVSGRRVCELNRNDARGVEADIHLRHIDVGGYEILSGDGTLILRLALKEGEPNVCILQGHFYSSTGELVAEGDDQDLRIYKGPAVLGKSGAARGIVIGD